MSVARRLLNRLDFVCQMQGSWVSIKGADVPADCGGPVATICPHA